MNDVVSSVSSTLQAFWSSFGVPAYVEGKVPSTAKYPYITYTLSTGEFMSTQSTPGRLWYQDSSIANSNIIVDKIYDRISNGVDLSVNGHGHLYLAPSSPFIQYYNGDEVNLQIVYFNITTHFLVL